MKPKLPIIHNLGRSGGTVFSKCIGCMEQVNLLSEIHPFGPQVVAKAFDPQTALDFSAAMQASHWYGLIPKANVSKDMIFCNPQHFVQLIGHLVKTSEAQGKNLVIRDWSHLDVVGQPFCVPTKQAMLIDLLSPYFDISSILLLRHPLRIWLSSLSQSKMSNVALPEHLDSYLTYLNLYRDVEQIQYEKFVAKSEPTLKRACSLLNIDYDAKWKKNWQSYGHITGDDRAKGTGKQQLKASPHPKLNADVKSVLSKSKVYGEIIERTGYPDLL